MTPRRGRLLVSVVLVAGAALGVEEWVRRRGSPSPTHAPREGAAEADEHGEEGEGRREVTLSEEGFRNARIETARARRERLVRALSFTGKVRSRKAVVVRVTGAPTATRPRSRS